MFNFSQREVTVAKGRLWEMLTKDELNQLHKGLHAEIPRLPGAKLHFEGKIKNARFQGHFGTEHIEARCDLSDVEFEAYEGGVRMGYKIENARGSGGGFVILAEGATGRAEIEGNSPWVHARATNGHLKTHGMQTRTVKAPKRRATKAEMAARKANNSQTQATAMN